MTVFIAYPTHKISTNATYFFFSFFFSLTAPCQYLQVHSKQSRPKHPDGEEERRKDERGRCGVLGLVKKISSRKKVETLRKSELDHIHVLFWILTTERIHCSYANVTLSIISNLRTLLANHLPQLHKVYAASPILVLL